MKKNTWSAVVLFAGLFFVLRAQAGAEACFDIDDTMFYLQTKIVLFEKGTGAPKEISTGTYARLKGLIGGPNVLAGGESNPYHNFELRFDAVKGSFQYFDDRVPEGTPSRNDFLNDVLDAVDPANIGKSAGPAWKSIQYSLSDPERAKKTCFITARQHDPKSIYEAFQFLKNKGFIEQMPLIENIYPVGNQKFKEKYGDSTAQAKASIIMERLDALEKESLADDLIPVRNREGSQYEKLHTWSFTDDDEENIKAAEEELGKAMVENPKRWAHVKIVLYHTPKNLADRKAFILKSDGTTRPMKSDEYIENFGTRRDPNASGRPAEVIPEAATIQSELKSVDESIAHMYVNTPVKKAHPKISFTPDLVGIEIQAIKDFIEDQSIPSSEKSIVLTRYSVSDPRVAAVAIQALKAGIPFRLITDFNMSVTFPDQLAGQEMMTDFKRIEPKRGSHGNIIRDLLKAGFQTNDPKWGLFSQPVFNPENAESMEPIMHEKSLLLMTKKSGDRPQKIRYFNGTANMTETPRLNRLWEIQDQDAALFAWNHAEALMKTFAKGGEIKDVRDPKLGPEALRIVYRDGSFQEIAYTNGRDNPNDRIEELLRSSKKIDRIILSHFVMTHQGIFNEFNAALRENPKLRITGVIDDKFVPTKGFGLASTMKKFRIFRPIPNSGAFVGGWPSELSERVALGVHLKRVEGEKERELDGYPSARDLQHDKTTIVDSNLFTGSLNSSTESRNAELQTWFQFPKGSRFLEGVASSMMDWSLKKPYSDHVIPLEKAVLRAAIGQMLGHSTLEIPNQEVETAWKALRDNDSKKFKELLRSVLRSPTDVVSGVPTKARIAEQLRTFEQQLDIYQSVPGRQHLAPQDIVGLMNVSSLERPRADVIAQELNTIYGEPSSANSQFQARGYAALKLSEHHRLAKGASRRPYDHEQALRAVKTSSATRAPATKGACAPTVEALITPH